ncbi:polysaccharide deacetylase family protein [Heliobacterium gestii]|uniref:Polysaccharide deacetylase family protein n=1 Tax=Heliomicrobium gestii TaxID=2699 RepID=A0A845LC21_HELGE|nr:polysaccharide deacetylase family protein [Heliomicrobium gestii]MBM7867172.1 peptidoglycan/xylan/chitin deacetylase (PgdA/CDA1 family) [Heliomicrobium gestii]MZP43728.1 polysaccharide deacetylase family protein [Heliomicrobium gestii]
MEHRLRSIIIPLMKLFFLSFAFFFLIQTGMYISQLAPEKRSELAMNIFPWLFTHEVVAMAGEVNYPIDDVTLTQGIIFAEQQHLADAEAASGRVLDGTGRNGEAGSGQQATTPILSISAPVGAHKSSTKVAYLTFDDGPSDITPQVLDILHRYGIEATFFVIGNQAESRPDTIRRIHSEGHLIGNHTYSHRYRQIYASPLAFIQDLQQGEEVLNQLLNERPKHVRAPGGTLGNMSSELIKQLTSQGYVLHDWNVDSKDTSAPIVGAESIRMQVLRQAADKQNAVILFHDGPGKITLPSALPAIIEGLKKQGFMFKSLDHIERPVVMYQN